MISLIKVSLSNILTGIGFSVEPGDYIGIAGPNGSGKSTLARIIKGIDSPSEGYVSVDGRTRRAGEVSRDIGLVLSNPENQLVSADVEEDVAFGLENMNLPTGEIAERVEDALRWAGLREVREVPAHHLSAGQQQMLVLAGIMAMRPKYLILDEATSMLGPLERASVLDAIKSMNREGVGVIHISHDLEELVPAKRLLLIEGGRIVWEGGWNGLVTDSGVLERLGMELPSHLKLKSLMLKNGYMLNEDAVTAEEVADEIAGIVSRKKV